jgi:hypothetical protein
VHKVRDLGYGGELLPNWTSKAQQPFRCDPHLDAPSAGSRNESKVDGELQQRIKAVRKILALQRLLDFGDAGHYECGMFRRTAYSPVPRCAASSVFTDKGRAVNRARHRLELLGARPLTWSGSWQHRVLQTSLSFSSEDQPRWSKKENSRFMPATKNAAFAGRRRRQTICNPTRFREKSLP